MHRKINLKDFKLIASDLDGTIKDSDQPIHPETVETFKKLHEMGISFTLASGRGLMSLRPFAEELNVSVPLVLANGCIIQSLDGQIHHREMMPTDVTRKVFEIMDQENGDLVVFMDDQLFIKKMTPNIERIFGWVQDRVTMIGSWDRMEDQIQFVNKFMIIDWEDVEHLRQIEKIVSIELDGKAEYLQTNFHHLEIMPIGVSKATGLEFLAGEMGISMKEIMAFGDYDNDADMLREVGLGVAVENATEKVKSNANLVIGSCADNGPAIFLKELMSNHS